MVMSRMLAIFIFIIVVLVGHELFICPRLNAKSPKGEFVDVETAKLHFLTRKKASDIESRENAPIVLIHGSSGSSADMELAFFELFPLMLTYTRLTARVGWSETKLHPLEMSDPMKQAEAIHMAVNKLKLKKPIIVGPVGEVRLRLLMQSSSEMKLLALYPLLGLLILGKDLTGGMKFCLQHLS